MSQDAGSTSIKPNPHETGTYYINGQTWAVGTRYTLLKLIGEGSFSQVCLARDNDTQERVALKRISDVLTSLEYAKRVLREVCILRRMDHPGIIALKDVFLKPASTGRCVYRKGQLVPTSLDLYLALEYCDQGDLFHMKGQISESEVNSIMYQLLQALDYLHHNGVWHRDVKTANILVTYTAHGVRLVKIADLGSARSAAQGGAADAAAPTPRRRGAAPPGGEGEGAAAAAAVAAIDIGRAPAGMHHSDSFMQEGPPSRSELFAKPVAGGGAGFKAPLTRMVCTPCYRAPEVVMSRGVYTKAIDMWSAGCVFGELLQRVPWLGKASTPHLQVAPVFAMHGVPRTPASGDRFSAPGPEGDSVTRQELKALFQVIGTPSWKCIEGVPSESWRNYLRRIPGRAPNLYRRFGAAGEVAVDLLQRLLTFDPDRRPSCREAMGHEYFSMLRAEAEETEDTDDAEAEAGAHGLASDDGGAAGGAGAAVGMLLDGPGGEGGSAGEQRGRRREDERQQRQQQQQQLLQREGAAPAMDIDVPDGAGTGAPEAKRARQQPDPQAARGDVRPQTSFCTGLTGEHYYNIDDPAVALAQLEEEMGAILSTAPMGSDDAAAAAASDAFRELLEREVAEHSLHLEARRLRGGSFTQPAGGAGGAPGAGAGPPSPPGRRGTGGGASAGGRSPYYDASAWRASAAGAIGISMGQEHAREDPGHITDPSLLGMRRLPHHADAAQSHLDSEKHLKAGRHGEWAPEALSAGPKTGASWGVTLMPPGYDAEEHPEMADIMRSQNKR